MEKNILIIFFLFILSYANIFAAENATWNEVNLFYRSKSPWFYALTLEGRTDFDTSSDNQYIVVPALGYILSQRHELGAGDQFFLTNHGHLNEQILWLQDQYDLIHRTNRILAIRSRFDQRFSQDNSEIAYRLRERLNYTWNNAIADKYSPVVYDEIFLNLNHPSWVSNKTLSQNRAFAGILLPINLKSAFLVGYLNRADYDPDEANHQNIFYISFNYNFGAQMTEQDIFAEQD